MNEPAAPTRIDTCPERYVLGQLVSGSLGEDQADRLFNHIGDCEACQQMVDQITIRSDSLIEAARKELPQPADKGNLSQLIENAQQLSPAISPTKSPDDTQNSPTHKRVTVDGFVEGLRRSGLFDEAEVLRFLSDVDQSDGDSTDSAHLAARLVGDGKLTTFQARALLRGRWKGLVLGNYVILEKIAQGGMGSVFKARHRRLGRLVCLKVMNSAVRKSALSMQRFRQEARTVAALDHPHIVVAHDADEAEGIPFIVMEYIEGKDLSGFVNDNGPFSAKQAIKVITQAATAMEYAHAQGVVHRDIKPHNLLLSENEPGNYHIKILDMGLARFDSLLADHPDASIHAAMTNTGVIMGTVDYMSPEQAVCSRDADNRSDIYSLGCTLHFLLTGKRIYDGETMMARLVAHREQPVPSIIEQRADISAGLEVVFHTMVAKQPDDRYQSMTELLADLHAVAAGQEPTRGKVSASVANAATASALPSQSKTPQSSANDSPSIEDAQPNSPDIPWQKYIPAAAGGGIVVAALFGLMSLFGPSAPSQPSVGDANNGDTVSDTTIIGHPSTIRNGGNGRALIIVPGMMQGKHFFGNEFSTLAQTLIDEKIEYEIASSIPGTARAKEVYFNPGTGTKSNSIDTTMTLKEFDTDDFDAVVLVGGDYWEFAHKNEEVHAALKSVANKAIDNGLVVATYASSWWAIEDGHIAKGCELKANRDHQEIKIGQFKDRPGTVIMLENYNLTYHLVRLAFKEFVAGR